MLDFGMMGPNLMLAERVVDWFYRIGGREIVLCAGARNLALVATVTQAAGFQAWNHPEERSAGFFALGRARESGRPVAVVVTSGTAVAELLPAVIEAHYLGIALVVISADRPMRFRGTGAPQTIEQPGIFGPHAEFLGEWEAAVGQQIEIPPAFAIRGPMHLNVCFDEPILDGEPEQKYRDSNNGCGLTSGSSPLAAPPVWDSFGDGGRLLVMVGALSAAECRVVLHFLKNLGAPVWVESTSRLWGESGLEHLWVRNPAKLPSGGPTHVLRLGGVPCDRLWRDLETRLDIRVRCWSAGGWPGLARSCENSACDLSRLLPPAASCQRNWSNDECRRPVTTVEIPDSETHWFAELSRRLPDGAMVFLGNSLPIREWQAAAVWRGGLEIYANRGVNGIDGEISTFLGLAAGHPGEAWGIFGDLTTLYDLAGPWILAQMPARRVRIVVVNNGGGGIFRELPQLRGADAQTRGMVCNEHSLDFAGWAALWKLPYVRFTSSSEWPLVRHNGPCVLEIVPAR